MTGVIARSHEQGSDSLLDNCPSHFDIVMPYGGKAYYVAVQAIKHLEEYCPFRKFYIVTDKRNFWRFKYLGVRDLVLIEEDELIPKVTYRNIQDYLYERGTTPQIAGWYLQQFLKMGMSRHADIADFYLIWDSDTIMLQPMELFTEDCRVILAQASERHEPYFRTYRRLMGMPPTSERSFIAEHMMVNSSHMRSLIRGIGGNSPSEGGWVWRILNSIDKSDLARNGFSEFETYGNFVCTHYPESVVVKDLPSTRDATKLFGLYPNKYDLFRLSYKYQYATFERQSFHRPRVLLEKAISRIYYEFFSAGKKADVGSH